VAGPFAEGPPSKVVCRTNWATGERRFGNTNVRGSVGPPGFRTVMVRTLSSSCVRRTAWRRTPVTPSSSAIAILRRSAAAVVSVGKIARQQMRGVCIVNSSSESCARQSPVVRTQQSSGLVLEERPGQFGRLDVGILGSKALEQRTIESLGDAGRVVAASGDADQDDLAAVDASSEG
jgi:hypothetical protein